LTERGWILANFFGVFIDRDELEVYKHAIKRLKPISSHLDQGSLANKGFIISDKTPKYEKASLWGKSRIPSGKESSILPARVANQSARFGSS